jgi:hypothetical protein
VNWKYVIFLTVFLLAGGCVSTRPPLPPDSLNQYRDTLVDLGVKSNQALTTEYDWNYRNFRERLETEGDIDPLTLVLRFCGGTFDWQWGECGGDDSAMPVFNVIAKSRSDLAMLNDLLTGYANLLIGFNGANSDTRADLEASAENIGNSVASISGRFGNQLDTQKIGAFSSIGVAAVEQLLAKKQRDGMAAVMQEFHPGVREFALLGSRAMEISAVGIKDEYGDEHQKLVVSIARESDGAKKVKLVEELLALNEQTSMHLDSLGSIYAAYRVLPNADAGLISALESGRRANLEQLIGHVEAISAAYQQFKAADSQ